MEKFRTISDLNTVPEAVAVTPHNFTGTGRRLAYAGPDDLRPLLNLYSNPWLFFKTAGILVRIASYGASVVWLPLGSNITVSGEVGYIVEGMLVFYELENIGNGTATVDGQSIPTGSPIKVRIREGLHDVPKALDPVLVDATNSPVRAVEQR